MAFDTLTRVARWAALSGLTQLIQNGKFSREIGRVVLLQGKCCFGIIKE